MQFTSVITSYIRQCYFFKTLKLHQKKENVRHLAMFRVQPKGFFIKKAIFIYILQKPTNFCNLFVKYINYECIT